MALRDVIRDGRQVLELLSDLEQQAVAAQASLSALEIPVPAASDATVSGRSSSGGGGSDNRGGFAGSSSGALAASRATSSQITADGAKIVGAVRDVASAVEALRSDLRGDGGAGLAIRRSL